MLKDSRTERCVRCFICKKHYPQRASGVHCVSTAVYVRCVFDADVNNQVGDTAGAIQHYELAGTHCVEVPRMLFERDRVEDLEEYITQVRYP